MLSFAARHLDSHPAASMEIYQRIAASPQIYGASTAQLAQTRGEAELGRGEFGARFEVFARRFVRQATDPAALAGMAVAGGAFQSLRLAAYSRLLANPAANFFTRGLGARGLSAGLAFAAEAPIFSATIRGANALLGRSQDWSTATMGHELASGYLMLGALRLSGAAGTSLFRRFNPAPAAAGSLQQIFFQQGTMLTGIVSAHWLEEKAGFRESQGGASLLADSLATLLHFNVAGRLLHGLTGNQFSRNMELRHEALRNSPPPAARPLLNFGPNLAPAGAGFGGRSFRPEVMAMSADRPSEGQLRPPIHLSEGSAESPRDPAPVDRDPAHYIPYRTEIANVGHLVYSMVNEVRDGTILWAETSLHVTRYMQDNFEADLPRLPIEHQSTQRRLIANLDEIRIGLELMRSSGQDLPFDAKAVELVSWIYRVANVMVNYLNSGELNYLQGSMRSAVKAVQILNTDFLPSHIVNRDSGETLGVPRQGTIRQIVSPGENPRNTEHRPFYDFIDATSDHLDIPMESTHRVLFLGDIPVDRMVVSRHHQVKFSETPPNLNERLMRSAQVLGNEWMTKPLPPGTSSTFDYVEAYESLNAQDFLSDRGKTWLEQRFFGAIRPGGVGLWVSRDSSSMERVVDIALKGELADVILGSYRGQLPLHVPSRLDLAISNFVFFRKLPQR